MILKHVTFLLWFSFSISTIPWTYFLQKYPIDDDIPPSKPTKNAINTESTETKGSTSTNIANNQNEHNVDGVGTNVEEAPEFDSGRPLSCKWTTGAGPRIGCVRDYPAELQIQALEQVNLSPRVTPESSASNAPIPSPRPSPKIHLSPRLACMGLLNHH